MTTVLPSPTLDPGIGDPRSFVADEPGRHAFVVAANRLPVHRSSHGTWEVSPGGMVAAVLPVARQRGGCWLGWDGSSELAGCDSFLHDDVWLQPVGFTQAERVGYYDGTANSVLWPLYHSNAMALEFRRDWWADYVEVNRRFAAAAAAAVARDGTLWVHDYHLQLVPAMVRRVRPDVRIGFYLHTPFPPARVFRRLPWREAVVEGVLGADVVGFQTRDDARNFLRTVDRLEAGTVSQGRDGFGSVSTTGLRRVAVGTFAVSVDVDGVGSIARRGDTTRRAAELRRSLGDPKIVMLGVDRLDYTKGIDARLEAFQLLLATRVLDPAEVAFVQVATPTRDAVPGYDDMRCRVEQLSGRINGQFGSVDRPVVHYLHRSLPFDEVVAHYIAADVMVVTPYGDGMNLVAKEFAASRVDETGVLVLSEFAGAADELQTALQCNPYDVESIADAMTRAVRIDAHEERLRMSRIRTHLRQHTIADWASAFLDQLEPRTRSLAGTRTRGPR